MILFSISGCSNIKSKNIDNNFEDEIIEKNRLEILYFHGTIECDSCILIGNYTQYSIDEFFKDEITLGKIIFKKINGEYPENKNLTKKYGVFASSLWFGIYKNGTFTKEENVDAWFKVGNKDDYVNYMKSFIEEKLKVLD